MKRSIPIRTAFLMILSVIAILNLNRCSHEPAPAERVILIGIDGVGAGDFQRAATPHLDALARAGALSLRTRGVMPTVSAPNWGSHLLGAGPEQHGITANGWTTGNHSIEPVTADEQGYFPSVFTLIRQQLPGAKTGFFFDWKGLADLFNPQLIDKVEFSDSFESTFRKAAAWIDEAEPVFTFIYAGFPDEKGHAHGWGSEEHTDAIESVDAAIGRFVQELQEAGMFERTHLLIVSDHGGKGYGHGGLSMEELITPWIIAGPGIIRDRVIEQPNDVMNTAATIAYLLNLEVPQAWTGRPVLGAFDHAPLSRENRRAFVHQPTPSLAGGMYDESQAVSFTVSDPSVAIRFTLDGTDPGPSSPVYKSPILMQRSALLKAAGSRDGYMSDIITVDFVKVLKVKSISLESPPDEKYAAKGPWTLVDRIQGTGHFTDGKWLGFSGEDLEASITLDERFNLSRCSIGFLNEPGSWIHPPQEISVLASVDGKEYSEIGRLSGMQKEDKWQAGRNQVRVKISPALTKYLKVIVKNAGTCPAGQPGEGEPAWLFVDEIILE